MSDFTNLETPVGKCSLKRTARKSLATSVLPQGCIEITAPKEASEDAILAKIIKRKRWISEQQKQFREWNDDTPGRRYVSGATHRYLGRQYRLRLREADMPWVRLKGGLL